MDSKPHMDTKITIDSTAGRTTPLPVVPGTVQTLFCGDLRSKKYYMRDEIITTEAEFMDASGHVFCYHTQMQVGPDGYRASPECCGSDRKCYRSALDKPEEYVSLPHTRINEA